MQNMVYLVCCYSDGFDDLDHEVLAAFSTYDKAEDFYLKMEPTLSPNKNLIIETIAVR